MRKIVVSGGFSSKERKKAKSKRRRKRREWGNGEPEREWRTETPLPQIVSRSNIYYANTGN